MTNFVTLYCLLSLNDNSCPCRNLGGRIKHYYRKERKQVAGGQGFEPRQAESESAVLPLDDPPALYL